MDFAFILTAALAAAFVLLVVGLLVALIYYRWRLTDSHRTLSRFIRENLRLREEMEKIVRMVLVFVLLQLAHPAAAQFYAGIGGGAAMGQCTFRSISESRGNPGIQMDVFGGYAVSPLLSLEVGFTTGKQQQSSPDADCDHFWLSNDGRRTVAPILDQEGSYYVDILTETKWLRMAVQANVNLLAIFPGVPDCWRVCVSPQLSAVSTKTTHHTERYDQDFSPQWHMGYGGAFILGYVVAKRFGLDLYGGATCLTGQRFDNVPQFYHTGNLIWEGGIRLSYLI